MGFGDSLRACQINEVNFGKYLSWCAKIGSLNVQYENAVWSWWSLVHTGAVDFPQIIAHHEVIQGLLLTFTNIHRTVFYTKVLIFVFHKGYLGPLLKIILTISLLQQIVCGLVVNFDVGYFQLVSDFVLVFLKLLEDVAQYSGNDAALLPLISATHRVCFTASRLSIGEDRSIITLQGVVNDGLG